MKGKAKLIRESDGKYHVYVRNYFWQKWKQCYDNSNKQITFSDIKEFGEVIRIECFDVITLSICKFNGFRGK